jgi:hypothetical protein
MRINYTLCAAISCCIFLGACGIEPTADVVGDETATGDEPASPEIASFAEALTSTLIYDQFDYSGSVITNEYATWNPTHTDAIKNPLWEMNSGTIFEKSGTAWTGVPDGVSPNALSTNGNDSAVFRMYSKRNDLRDVAVTVTLKNNGLTTTSRTPATDWDGVHIWLRYLAEDHLYYISVNRRDNTIVAKKKIPGGPSNGGTYYVIGKTLAHKVPYGSWQTLKATAKNLVDGSVQLKLYETTSTGTTLLLSAIDNGSVGGAPLRTAGRIGVRGDNCNFQLGKISVTSY